MDRNYSTESSDSEFEMMSQCAGPSRADSCELQYNYGSLENIILSLCDHFDLKIVYDNEHVQKAVTMTTGLAIAGSVVGKYLGGKMGAAAGGTVGGLCGLGVSYVHLRNIWNEVKPKLMDIYDLVYDYLAGLGIHDYRKALPKLFSHTKELFELVHIITTSISHVLGKKVTSSITSTTKMPSPRALAKHAKRFLNNSY